MILLYKLFCAMLDYLCNICQEQPSPSPTKQRTAKVEPATPAGIAQPVANTSLCASHDPYGKPDGTTKAGVTC